MTLNAKQSAFTRAAAVLILTAFEMGYTVTLGDAYRDDRCQYGAANSKHKRRLAIDLNLFKNGKYLQDTQDHLPLGKIWESMGGIWGGWFSNPDGNHYEWPD